MARSNSGIEIAEHDINLAYSLVRRLYKDEYGNPMELTPKQAALFWIIFKRLHPRINLRAFTRFGKSLDIALAVLTRCLFTPDRWAIISGKMDRAHIVMDYVIQHIFDNPISVAKFHVDPGENMDYIRRYRNKQKLTFLVKKGNPRKGIPHLYSEIFIGTAKDAIGFGANNVIEDEASLIPDDEHALVMRMLGDKMDNMLVKVGNPFHRNHFLKSSRDPNYIDINIDAEQGIEEGRITRKFLEEQEKNNPLYSVLYENKFPEEDSIDEDGYYQLVRERDLDVAYVDDLPGVGEGVIGVDIADGGDNYSTIVCRKHNVAKLYLRIRTKDPMILIPEIEKVARAEKMLINDETVIPDKGGNVAFCARMNELYPFKQRNEPNDFGVLFGERPEKDGDPVHYIDKEMKKSVYLNRRAQMYMRTQKWLLSGGKLSGEPYFDELLDIRWKVQSDKMIKIKAKEDMLKDGIASPDVADALALTFAKTPGPINKPFKQGEWQNLTNYGI